MPRKKLHILAELAEGLLTDAQAVDKYQLSPNAEGLIDQLELIYGKPELKQRPRQATFSLMPEVARRSWNLY